MLFLYIFQKYQNTIYCNSVFLQYFILFLKKYYFFLFFLLDYSCLMIHVMSLKNLPGLTCVVFLYLFN